ncbi:MAG: T9SS type A sorting domain-containing protein [Bacteroidales bacterium]
MTKSLLVLIIFLGSMANIGISQDSIPNSNFESWITDYNPLAWEMTNLLLPTGTLNCFRSDVSYYGSYAMQLKTIDVFGTPVPGVATLGTMELNNTIGGIPFTERPLVLKGFYQHASNGDEVMVAVELFKNGATIGGGVWSTTDSVPYFQEFSIPINYSSGVVPDTMNITILTDPYQIGSGLIIDALSFEYNATGIPEKNENEIQMSCFPNPVASHVSIGINNAKEKKIYLYSINGRLMKKVNSNLPITTMDLQDLQAGSYILISFDGKNKLVRKIVKL